jgi:hypothetical protein
MKRSEVMAALRIVREARRVLVASARRQGLRVRAADDDGKSLAELKEDMMKAFAALTKPIEIGDESVFDSKITIGQFLESLNELIEDEGFDIKDEDDLAIIAESINDVYGINASIEQLNQAIETAQAVETAYKNIDHAMNITLNKPGIDDAPYKLIMDEAEALEDELDNSNLTILDEMKRLSKAVDLYWAKVCEENADDDDGDDDGDDDDDDNDGEEEAVVEEEVKEARFRAARARLARRR